MFTRTSTRLQYANAPKRIEDLWRRSRNIVDDCDLLDDVLVNVEAADSAINSLTAIADSDPDIAYAVTELRDVSTCLVCAARAVIDRAEAEATALWCGPNVGEVEAALHKRRREILPAWWRNGAFDSVGDFVVIVEGTLVRISPSGAWRIEVEANGVFRHGTGLALLRSVILGESYPVTIGRLAVKLNIPACEPEYGMI